MHNRTLKTLIAWTVLICTILAVFSACGKKEVSASSAPTQATESTEATTPAPVSSELKQVETTGSLTSWEMNANVWSSSNGATVTFTAIPKEYAQSQAVYFVVHLDGEKKEDIPCKWDGKYYTASADLEAADGYEFECVIFQGQGEGESIPLSDAYDSLVYLQTSLAAYSNLYISDFKVEDGKFEVTAGFAHVQLPQLTADGSSVSFVNADLVFSLNGEKVESKPIDLPKGEGVGSHEASLSAISFTMPQMDDDYQLDLSLEVNLSNGEQLTANGGSWFYNNGELKMAAG